MPQHSSDSESESLGLGHPRISYAGTERPHLLIIVIVARQEAPPSKSVDHRCTSVPKRIETRRSLQTEVQIELSVVRISKNNANAFPSPFA